jgi:CRP-like cAMP-binding protein
MNNLFENVSEKNKEKILKILEANTFTFKKNTTILSFLKKYNIIGFVEEGYIQIIETDYNGNKIIMEEVKENEIFGSMFSSISNDECSIITKEDSKITIIEYSNIIQGNKTNYSFYHQFIFNLLNILSNKINEKNNHIEILTKKSIRNKLLEYFKIMSKKTGSKNIFLSLSFTELAEYLAIDRSAMSRELKNLKDEGFIEIKNKKITLLY